GTIVSSFSTFAFSGTNIFAGSYSAGVFLSTDNGSSWNSINTGLTDTDVLSLAIKDDTLFAGTFSSGVWKRSLSEIITSTDDRGINMPTHFNLAQNYPNPFNPTTTISYSIQQRSNVSLKVFDILGNEVSTLFNEEKDRGVYSVTFDAIGLASGMYLYKLQAGSFVETKKMILIK
ncbi:MAG: T9SS type A sorting domain-containing protein, partial [Melioribacteraceae bacterium]